MGRRPDEADGQAQRHQVGPARSTLAALLFLVPALLPGGEGRTPAYETVSLPPGEMTLAIPLNAFLNIDYLAIPVRIGAGLRLGRHEVSRGLWQACHLAGACAQAGLGPGRPEAGHPMVGIDWHEARAFARWYSKATGRRWRLPTEHEWFYAASLGKGWRSEPKTYDYSDLQAVRSVPKVTYTLGHFGRNAWGLADMEGNVWEWTLGCYALAEERLLRPQDPRLLDDPDACSTRIVGGEHRAEVPDFVRDTYNGGCAGLMPAANLGLRLVMEEP